MRLGGQIVPFQAASLLSLVLLPIGLVFGFLHLHLSDFFDLIVVDNEHLSLNIVILEMLLSLSSISWLLEANKSKGITGASVLESDALNLTVRLEEKTELLLVPAIWEVLYVQVASLL